MNFPKVRICEVSSGDDQKQVMLRLSLVENSKLKLNIKQSCFVFR